MPNTTDPLVISHDCVILDACAVINLYATGQMEAILQAIPKAVTIAEYVHEVESLTLHGGASGESESADEMINLQPFIDSGILTVVSPDTEKEKLAFIDFSAALGDDGEAVTGAIATYRDWAIATDDKHAIRFFKSDCPHLQLLSSLELVKNWVDKDSPAYNIVRLALSNIDVRATYKPGKGHSLYRWWASYREA